MKNHRGLGPLYSNARLVAVASLILLSFASFANAQPAGETPVLVLNEGPLAQQWGKPWAQAEISAGPGELTITFWLYRFDERTETEGFVTQTIIGDPNIHFGFDLGSDGVLRFSSSTGAPGSAAQVNSPAPLPLRNWIHVAGTVDAQNIRLFLDGTEVASDVTFGPLGSPSPEPLFVRGQEEALSSIQIWNRAMTGIEIMSFATNPPVGNEADLIAFWPLDDGFSLNDEARNLVLNGPALALGGSDDDPYHPADPGWLPARAIDGFPYFADHLASPVWDVGRLVDLDDDGDLDIFTTAVLCEAVLPPFPYYPMPPPTPATALENAGG